MFFNSDTIDKPFTRSLRASTTARIGIGHSGGRYTTRAQLEFQADYAAAKDAVHLETTDARVRELGLLPLASTATSRESYLRNTSLGRKLDEASCTLLEKDGVRSPDVQLIAGDGLSAEAFQRNFPDMWPLLKGRLQDEGLRLGTPLFVNRARVAVMDHVGEIVKPRCALILIGERPGLGTSDSLSGYFEFEPGHHRVESDRNVLSNIHAKGVPPTEAALMLAEALIRVLALGQSGMHVRFDFH